MNLKSNTQKTNFKFDGIVKKNLNTPTITVQSITTTISDTLNYDNKKINDINYVNYSNIMDDGYTPQGFTIADKKAFISSYKSGENSRLYVYDLESNKNLAIIELENKAHSGGCSFSEDKDLLFVTGDWGKISVYDYSKLKPLIESNTKKPTKLYVKELDDLEDLKENYLVKADDLDAANRKYSADNVRASTMCIDGNLVYVCQCIANGKGKMRIFEMEDLKDENEIKSLETNEITDYTIDAPSFVQGMAIKIYNGQKYIIFSQSFGGISSITICKQNSDYSLETLNTRYVDASKIEGIYVDDNGIITAITEDEHSQKTYNYTIEEILSKKDNGIKDVFKHEWQRFTGTYWQHGVADDFYNVMHWNKDSKNLFEYLRDMNFKAFPSLYSLAMRVGGATFDYVLSPLINIADLASVEQNRLNYMDFVDDTAAILNNNVNNIEKHGFITGNIEGNIQNLNNVAMDVSKLGWSSLFTIYEYEHKVAEIFGVDSLDKNDVEDTIKYISSSIDNLKNDINDKIENVAEEVDLFEESVGETLNWYGEKISDAWDATASFVTDSSYMPWNWF